MMCAERGQSWKLAAPAGSMSIALYLKALFPYCCMYVHMSGSTVHVHAHCFSL